MNGSAAGISGLIARRPLAILVALLLAAWLPGFFTLPPLDRDESRFAQATKQMLETGDFVSIRLGEEARDQKPVGIYWLQAASTAALGSVLPDARARTQIWTYRVPSLLGALGAVLLVFYVIRPLAGTGAAFTAGLLLGLSVLLMAEMKIAKTDAVLLAMIVAAQCVLMQLYLAARAGGLPPGRLAILLGWAAFAFGILVKGPVVVLVCGATLAVLSLWDRDWHWLRGLRPWSGLAVTLAIVLPWAIAIYFATDGAFYRNSLGTDFAMKLAGGQESHGAPPGYYTLLAPLTFWPATLVLLPALVFGIRNRRLPHVRFLLVWAAVVWVMFEVAPTKLPHYVLPAYPALAMLGALWWMGRGGSGARSERIALWGSAILFGVSGAALAVFLLWAPAHYGTGAPVWAYLDVALVLAVLIAAAAFLVRGRSGAALGAASLAGLLLYTVAGFGTVPALQHLWISPRLAAAVERHAMAGDPPVIVAGFAEPSVRFLLGTRTLLETGGPAAEAAAARGGLVAVEARERSAFFDALGTRARAIVLERIEGLNYSNGREITLTLYRVVPQAPSD